jgi:hypothetical protein
MLHERAKLQANHERFVRRVIEHELIWGLDRGNGFAWCECNDDADASVILFWSDEAYARRAMKTGLDDCALRSITLFDFLFRWLPGMDADGALAGCNWTEDLAGIESQASDLQAELATAMPDEMIQQYQDELRQQIAAQNNGA